MPPALSIVIPSHNRPDFLRACLASVVRHAPAEAESILLLLHGFSRQQLTKKETFETLIDYLTHPNLFIRELE